LGFLVIKELMYKWFGIEPIPCATCEVLRSSLDESNRERRDLLARLLDKANPEPSQEVKEEHTPIQPNFVPWRVRQQMLEAEDRKQAQLMRDKKQEIDALEKELGVTSAS
jgi:hypothetical protein